ncbi:MAG: metallophosphoesterase family protein [Acutalibacteraceae bacterium]
MNVINYVKGLIAVISIFLTMVFVPGSGQAYTAKDPEAAKLVFSVVSDIHVESNNPTTYSAFKNIINDLKNNKSADATVFLGDNTMNGQGIENALFFGAVKTMKDDGNIFVMTGNHDLSNGEGSYKEHVNRFIDYNNNYLKNKIDKPYYYRVVNGYYMIFLSTEKATVNEMYISQEQLTWLKGVMDEAAQSGKPIFVFSHYPMIDLEGEDTTVLADILYDYDDVYFFNGHTHEPFDTYTYMRATCVNVPRTAEKTEESTFEGVVVEVYEDEVLIRQRNFYDGQWVNE